jgi:V8-like Glu-specific endopeptidase
MERPFEIDRNDDQICYSINTSPDVGGSTLYIQVVEKYYIIGVHVRRIFQDYRKGIGQAVFLNETRIERIRKWIEKAYRENNIEED